MLVQERTPKFLLRGTLGSFVKYGSDGQEAALRAGQTPRSLGDAWGVEDDQMRGNLVLHVNSENDVASKECKVKAEKGAYETFYAGLADSIERRAPLLVDPKDAAAVIAILEQAKATFLNEV